MKKFFAAWKPGDFIIILGILLLSLAALLWFWQPQTNDLTCVISQNQTIIQTIPLGKNIQTQIPVDGQYHNNIVIENDQVYFTESNCPNQECVHQGRLSQAGDIAVCLPNRVMVRIISVSSKQSEVDIIVK